MTDSPIRLLIHGASGRMGQTLVRLCSEFPRLNIVAAVARSAPDLDGAVGFDASNLDALPAFDLCVDFSLPQAFDPILSLCVRRRATFVSGTTGLDQAQLAHLDTAAQHIGVLWSANFSLGVAILSDLVQRAAAALPEWQRDIIESHHIGKQDAPSGTALALGQAMTQNGGPLPHYASVRAGDIVGEHLVQLTGRGERLELVHRATDRDIFARGALHCATALIGRAPGRYRVIDLLN